MHIYFSGIGGTAIGPLALIAKQAGYEVSGSDKQDSQYIEYLKKKGITDIHIGQSKESIAEAHSQKPIDWYVYSSAVAIEKAPELEFVQEQGIKSSKRDDLLNQIIQDKNLKLIAIAGTHGKTTTTAMAIWLFKELGVPLSYSVGAKISFGEMGQYLEGSEYFVYEADEFDRNFLSFKPHMSIITGIDWDHPDIYPTRDEYYQAFKQFLNQSEHAVIWQEDAHKIGVVESENISVLNKNEYAMFELAGKVNRENAAIAAQAIMKVTSKQDVDELAKILNKFPGISRRFEELASNIYTDYAHTPEKIRGALQLAKEVAGENVAVVYEGLHNTRQHFIKDELPELFAGTKKLYVVPSYRAREDQSLEDLTPEKLVEIIKQPNDREPIQLNESLKQKIEEHANNGDLVLCLTAGGGNSLDEWLRKEFTK